MNNRKIDTQKKFHRIVVKIGTSVLTTESGRLDYAQLQNLVSQLSALASQGHQVIVVTSGAIAVGVEAIGLERRPTAIPELQAAASVGQGLLIQKYAELFGRSSLNVGQILLTQYDFTFREHYLNAKNTLEKLLEFKVIPIINENDSTAVEEIRYGDNDGLAALVSCLAEADLLVLLSDIEGLYSSDPRQTKEAKLIETIEEISPDIERLAGGAGTCFGSGGMATKLEAAKIVTSARIAMVIAHGRQPNVLLDIVAGRKAGTRFLPKKKKMASRKLWIAFAKTAKGTVVIDDGARDALVKQGKSLLPAGVTACHGEFEAGDAVEVADKKGRVFGRGLTSFSSTELSRIKGLKSRQVASILPDAANEEVIHRDCLVILEQEA